MAQLDRFAAETQSAVVAAREAGDLVRAAFAGPGGGAAVVRWRRNGPNDVVTRVDRASERAIDRRLRRAFPSIGFVGEETRPRSATGPGPSRSWVVDPIDGTVGFVSGLPFFSISVALAVDEAIVLGVVHDPVHGETFVAERGRGAWLLVDGALPERLALRRVSAVADAVVSGDPGDPDDEVAVARVDEVRRRVRVVRTLGSTALSLAYLAGGRLDGVLQVRGLEGVDIAAGGLLAIEAGARVSDASGGRWLDPRDLAHGRGVAAGGRAVQRCLLGRPPRAGRAQASAPR